ncbi:MAG TPA: cytochrome c [Bacteroidia bacterium]|nr:cytochrome c [Bacteroidia bacterium]
MKRTIYIITALLMSLFFTQCTSNNQPDKTADNNGAVKKDSAASDKGIGKFTAVRLTHPLDDSMAARGNTLYDSKCISCHKITDEKLVGPGWKGVTDRRTPEWIMNFISNTNVMLDSDLVAQQLMVTCTTRMPNQNLSDDQARAILEFMRKNDGKK